VPKTKRRAERAEPPRQPVEPPAKDGSTQSLRRIFRTIFVAATAAAALSAVVKPWTLVVAVAFAIGLTADYRIRKLEEAGSLSIRGVLNDLGMRGIAAVGVALFGITVFLAVGPLARSGAVGSISTQLDQVKSEAARAHLYPITFRRLDLHGSGADSYLVVLRERFPETVAPVGPSDQLRIYDVVRGRLQLSFSFNPAPPAGLPNNCFVVGTQGGSCTPLPAGVDHQPGWQFAFKTVSNLWDTGGPVVLGDWSEPVVVGVPESPNYGNHIPMPVAIYWSPATDHYVIAPLITNPWARGMKIYSAEAYQHPDVLRDPRSGLVLKGYTVDSWSVLDGSFGKAILALFGSGYSGHRQRAVIGGTAPVPGSPPKTWRCSVAAHAAFAKVQAPGGPNPPSAESLLVRAWKAHRSECEPLTYPTVQNTAG
jgi:hypothetical protein